MKIIRLVLAAVLLSCGNAWAAFVAANPYVVVKSTNGVVYYLQEGVYYNATSPNAEVAASAVGALTQQFSAVSGASSGGLTDAELRATAVPVSAASGTIASGAMVDLGSQADAACATDNGTCSQIALQKRTNQRLTTLDTSVNAANAQLPAALGTAATASSLSTAISTSDAGPVAPGAATATRGISPVGTYTAAGITLTDGQQAGARLTSAGALQTNDAATLAQATTIAGAIKAADAASGGTDLVFPAGCIRDDGLTTLTPIEGDYVPCRTNSVGAMWVVQSGVIATSGGITGGQAAHDAAISGNPIRAGGHAVTANPTAVATGDTVNWIGTTVGAQIVYPWSIPDATWQYASAADVTDTTSTEMKGAVASTRNYVGSCTFSNTDATVGTYVNVLSAATVIGVVYVAPQVASTSGVNSLPVTFTPPLRGAVNEAINFQAVTTSAQLRVMCQGFASAH